ncbi:MAG: metallophosphoesterase, partial [Planctomycetota bacterium]
KSLTYLTDCQPIMLDEQTFLVGEDGWGDGTHGDFANSHVQLNDFRLIKDFRQLQGDQWLSEMVRLGEESADRLSQKLNELSSEARKLFVLTHVPPYRKACLYEGLPADDDWAPFFVCGQIGDVLSRFAATRTDLQINVLCGHTHHRGDILIAPNLRVRTAAAEYAHPRIEQVIETTKTDAH